MAYHLDTATEATKVAIDLAGGYEDLIGGLPVTIASEHDVALIRHGDSAIRAAVSAVDTALMAVNQILKLGVAVTKVTPATIVKELRKSVATVAIADAIEAVTRSIMFDALAAYRNWVTHRGAPRIVARRGALGGTGAVSLDELVVTCYPFVPPVFRSRLSSPAQIPALKTPKRVTMADGRVAFQMFEEIVIHAGRVTLGDLDADRDEYVQKNQERVEIGRIRVGGEELAQYPAREFIRAVNTLVWTLRKALACDSDLDMRLATAAGLPARASSRE